MLRSELNHLPLVPHIHALVNWVNMASDNGLSPGRRQAIIWTNALILLIVNFRENLFDIHTFSSEDLH